VIWRGEAPQLGNFLINRVGPEAEEAVAEGVRGLVDGEFATPHLVEDGAEPGGGEVALGLDVSRPFAEPVGVGGAVAAPRAEVE
jgi:hypothetical protein